MNTRERFIKRHEKNIEKEKTAGVIKPYVEFEPPFAFNSTQESIKVDGLQGSFSTRDKVDAKSTDDEVVMHSVRSSENFEKLTAYNWLKKESNDNVKTFRVTTASASCATRVDKIRVSQRMSRI